MQPHRIDLSPRRESADLMVRNASTRRMRCAVKVAAWAQTVDGEMKLGPTRDVAVSPAALQLDPGEERGVRVSARAGAGPVEQAYRVIVEELPPEARAGDSAEVPVLSRIGIPVFLAPAKPEAKASLEGLRIERGRARFSLWSRGSVHVRPLAVKLVAMAAGDAPVFEKSADTWYVLAGTERRYDLGIPDDLCDRVRAVRVEVTLGGEVLRDEIATPQGACAR